MRMTTMANEVCSSDIELPCHYTEADLAAMPSELPTGTILYELHRGRIVTMPPLGDLPRGGQNPSGGGSVRMPLLRRKHEGSVGARNPGASTAGRFIF